MVAKTSVKRDYPSESPCPKCRKLAQRIGFATFTVREMVRHASEFQCLQCESKICRGGVHEMAPTAWIVFLDGKSLNTSGL